MDSRRITSSFAVPSLPLLRLSLLSTLLPGTTLVLLSGVSFASSARASVTMETASLVSVTSVASVAADSVTGMVIGPDGKPVSGATVYIVTYKEPNSFVLAATVKTDDTGKFKVMLEPLPVPKGMEGKPIDFKWYGIATVVAPGCGTIQRTLTSRANGNIFTLTKPSIVSGTVVDEKNAPISNATVTMRDWNNGSPNQNLNPFEESFLMPMPGLPDGILNTKTGPDGKWTLPLLPGKGNISFTVETPGHLPDLSNRKEPDAVLKAGATVSVSPYILRASSGITGRILFEGTNKPVKGAEVQAHPDKGGVVGRATTKEDGTYRVEGLSSGPYTISVTPAREDSKWVAIPQTGIDVVDGKSIAAKDISLVPGISLDGTVTDADTKTPIAGVELLVQGVGKFSATGSEPFSNPETDANGQFHVVVPPGKTQVQIVGVPEGYLNLSQNAESIDVRKGESKPVTLTLIKGLTAEGTVVGEDNKPLEGIRVRVLGTDDYDYDFAPNHPKSDAKGHFRVSSLMKNKTGYRITVDPEWEVVSPKKFTLPTTETNPLVVTLKKRTVLTLSGRVISTDGKPLSGAQVGIYARVEEKDGRSSQRNENRQAGADGTYSITNIRPDETVIVNAYMNGYKYRSGGALTKSESGIRVSDIAMVPLNGKITGEVIRASATGGKRVPVSGAYVWSSDGDEKAFAVTDSKGHFILTSIPKGSISVMSASGRSAPPRETKASGSITLTLPAEPKASGRNKRDFSKETIKSLQHSVLSQMAAEIKGKPNSDRSVVVSQIAADDPSAAFALAKAAHKDGNVPDGVIANIIEARAKVNPIDAAVWAAPYIEAMKYPLVKCRVEGELAIALAPVQPIKATQFYKAAIADGQDGNALTINRARLVATAAILRNGEAAAQLAKLKEALLAPSAKNERVRCAWLVARGDTAMADSLVAELPPSDRGQYYGEMARRSLEISPTNAERYLSKLIAARAELKKGKSGGNSEDDQNGETLDWLLSSITPKVLAVIGPSNPRQTLALARAYVAAPNDYGKQWLVLGLAARVQSKANAPTVWQEAVEAAGTQDWMTGSSLASLACLAATSATTDPAIAADLWQKAKKASVANNYVSGEPESFAYSAARFDPALARMIIERALVRYLTTNPTTTASPYQATQALIALSAVDPELALKRLRELDVPVSGTDSSDSSASIAARGRLAILKLLTLSDAERATISTTDVMSGLWEY